MARKRYGLLEEEKNVLERIAYLRQPIKLLPSGEKQKPRKSFKGISDVLNCEGIKPQAAKQWTEMLVRNVYFSGKRP